MTNVAAEGLATAGEVAGVDLLAGATEAAMMAGAGSIALPALGIGLLAYELMDLLWLYIHYLYKNYNYFFKNH